MSSKASLITCCLAWFLLTINNGSNSNTLFVSASTRTASAWNFEASSSLMVSSSSIESSSTSTSTSASESATCIHDSRHSFMWKLRGGELHHPETAQDVDALIMSASANHQLVVIDFTASWCGPCKAIAPLFQELADSISNVVFLKVDVDENPETAAKYSVSAMPTFLFLKQGEIVDRLMGANAARLQELISEHS